VNSLGERVREARLGRGLTQGQLAQGLVSKGFVSQVEHDLLTPSLARLRLLADRLQLPLSHFIGEPAELTQAYLHKSAELAVRAGEPAQALQLVEEGLGAATDDRLRADLLRIKGCALDALGRWDEALVAHQAAAAAAPAADADLNAAIYCEIATVLELKERFNAAVEANLRALAWLERSPHADPTLSARVLTNLGVESYHLGQIERASSYLQGALAAATGAESLLRMAKARMALGVSARAQGDLQAAIEHCDRALELYRRIGWERIGNRVLNNLGDVEYAAGHRRKARDYQLRCLERAQQLDDQYEVGISAAALARYALDAGEHEEAIRFARLSQRAAAQAGDHLHQALALALEGHSLDRTGQTEPADRCFKRAIRMLLQRQAGEKLAEVCVLYAQTLRDRGSFDRAFDLLRMASERDFSRLSLGLTPGG
jgi:HTH-type transcriptional regulator, quorum sensing regulator NprR